MANTQNSFSNGPSQETMPALFFGHGSPMNVVADNAYTQTLNKLGLTLPTPKTILSISAHWLTEGTFVTSTEKPKTIHDFYGFPQELFNIQYNAPGSQTAAMYINHLVENPRIKFDNGEWGLDHGTWTVLKHLYPKADIPVLQLSIDINQPPEFHYNLGMKLRELRKYGVMIIGSGNIVHNLRRISWKTDAEVLDWAREFDLWFKDRLEKRDFTSLMKEFNSTESGRLSVPTPDHYYPALYIMGAAADSDKMSFVYEEIQNASISMRSFMFA